MGKKSKSKAKKKASAAASAAAAEEQARATDKERDEKRIHRAATQLFPPRTKKLLQRTREEVARSRGWFPDKESVLATAKSEHDRSLLDRMVDHDHECQRIMDRLDELHNQNKHAEVVKLATDTIENTKAFVTRLYGKMNAYMPVHHIQAYQIRCHCRVKLEDFEGAVADATEGLAMVHIRKPAVAGTEPAVQKMEARMLYDRGICLLMYPNWNSKAKSKKRGHVAKMSFADSEKLDNAIRDLRACLAVARASREWWRTSSDGDMTKIDDLSATFLYAVTQRKVRDKAKRPHYSAESLVSLCKDACLGPYSFDRHICIGCNAVPTDDVKLHTCKTCRKFWFCGTECLSRTWKDLHKPLCKPDDAFGDRGNLSYYYVSDYEKAAIDEKIDQDGFFCIHRGRSQNTETSTGLPLMVVRDDATGFYFDSFTDHPFIFLPSQSHLVVQAGSNADDAYETMDGVAYLIDVTGKMTARQKSLYRKLIIKLKIARRQLSSNPEVMKDAIAMLNPTVA